VPNWIALNQTLQKPNQDVRCQIIMSDLCSSELLRSEEWVTVTNIPGPVIGPILEGQEIQNREQSISEVN